MKVITAIGIPEINERLKKEKIYEIIGRDIQYQEGIIEVLEERNDIEGLIVSNSLPEEVDFKTLVSRILEISPKIEIIVFLKEKSEEIELFLNSQKIYKIYYLDDYEVFFMNLKSTNEEISKSIEEFKKVILKEPIDNFYKEDTSQKMILSRGKIISITGTYGTGKSVISILIAKYLSKNKKVLLIDSDYFNSSINTILGINKMKKNYKNIISKYEGNLYVLCLEENDFINYECIIELFNKTREEYDFIIIDTSSDLISDKNRIILSNSSKIIDLIEPNLSEIKKANIFLEKVLKDFEIEREKINIIFNKINKYKISTRVLKEIYSEIKIIGEIEYSERYNLLINKNILKEHNLYEQIFQKLLE